MAARGVAAQMWSVGHMGKNIRRRWGDFYGFISYEVGDKSEIRFWHDV